MQRKFRRRFRWELLGAAVILLAAPGAPLRGQSKPPAKPSATPAAKQSSTAAKATTSSKNSTAKKKKQPVARRARGQAAPTKERIREIQAALAKSGFYDDEPGGVWDSKTADAMKRFQQANGLPPTGKLDARSLQKLGLGSTVAGTSAPLPPAGERGPSSNPQDKLR